MKLPVRAALAALVSLTAAVAALLPAAPATAAAAASPTAAPLIGTWANINPDPTKMHVKDVVFTTTAHGVMIDAFTASCASDCEWGNVHSVLFTENNTPGIDPTNFTAFRGEWSLNHGRGLNMLVGQLEIRKGNLVLIVQEPYLFMQRHHQPAGQTDYTVGEVFRLTTTPVTATMNGKGRIDYYPAGNYVTSMDDLLGTWTNPGGALSRIVLTKDGRGQLAVHGYGACTSDSPCDWGRTYGITLAPPGATQAVNFLAPFYVGDKHTTICVALDSTGTSLQIHEFTDYIYTGGHHRDAAGETYTNSHIVETLTKA